MDLIESKDVFKYLQKEDYFDKIKKQLSKDFNNFSFDKELDTIFLVNSDLLLSLIVRFLNQIFVSNPESFFELMYRIDMPEKAISQLFLEAEIDFAILANLVLKREFLKILLREKYSN